MRHALGLAAAATVLLTVGCTAVEPPAPTPTSGATGTLSVTATQVGGPAPGTSWPAQAQRVEVRSGSRSVTSGLTDSKGQLTFTLAAGTYTLVCGVPSDPVVVSPGGHATGECIYPVP